MMTMAAQGWLCNNLRGCLRGIELSHGHCSASIVGISVDIKRTQRCLISREITSNEYGRPRYKERPQKIEKRLSRV